MTQQEAETPRRDWKSDWRESAAQLSPQEQADLNRLLGLVGNAQEHKNGTTKKRHGPRPSAPPKEEPEKEIRSRRSKAKPEVEKEKEERPKRVIHFEEVQQWLTKVLSRSARETSVLSFHDAEVIATIDIDSMRFASLLPYLSDDERSKKADRQVAAVLAFKIVWETLRSKKELSQVMSEIQRLNIDCSLLHLGFIELSSSAMIQCLTSEGKLERDHLPQFYSLLKHWLLFCSKPASPYDYDIVSRIKLPEVAFLPHIVEMHLRYLLGLPAAVQEGLVLKKSKFTELNDKLLGNEQRRIIAFFERVALERCMDDIQFGTDFQHIPEDLTVQDAVTGNHVTPALAKELRIAANEITPLIKQIQEVKTFLETHPQLLSQRHAGKVSAQPIRAEFRELQKKILSTLPFQISAYR